MPNLTQITLNSEESKNGSPLCNYKGKIISSQKGLKWLSGDSKKNVKK